MIYDPQIEMLGQYLIIQYSTAKPIKAIIVPLFTLDVVTLCYLFQSILFKILILTQRSLFCLVLFKCTQFSKDKADLTIMDPSSTPSFQSVFTLYEVRQKKSSRCSLTSHFRRSHLSYHLCITHVV